MRSPRPRVQIGFRRVRRGRDWAARAFAGVSAECEPADLVRSDDRRRLRSGFVRFPTCRDRDTSEIRLELPLRIVRCEMKTAIAQPCQEPYKQRGSHQNPLESPGHRQKAGRADRLSVCQQLGADKELARASTGCPLTRDGPEDSARQRDDSPSERILEERGVEERVDEDHQGSLRESRGEETLSVSPMSISPQPTATSVQR